MGPVDASNGHKIRRARRNDCPTIVRLIRELATYEKLEAEANATVGDMEHYLFGPRIYAEALLAEVEGEAVGFALYFFNFSTFRGKPGLYLEDLFVRPEHRGLGLGKALFTTCARIAVEKECGRFEWAVLDWNEPAIGFYRSLGARPMEEWTVNRLDNDALISAAKLAPAISED